MKHLFLPAFVLLAAPLPAAIVYSGVQNIAIPTNFEGVYIDLDNRTVSQSPFIGWDINLFFGGVGIAGSTAFQPARAGTANNDTLTRFSVNDLVNGTLPYATGENGSSDHLNAPNNFQSGVEGYIGFKFTKNDTTGPYFGWTRVTLTANTPGAVVSDWAWEDTADAILAGAVPEPSHAMLIILGVAGLSFRRRRHVNMATDAPLPA